MSFGESSPGPTWGVVFLRIVVGAVLLCAGWGLITSGGSEQLVLGARERIAQAPGIVRAFGENLVLVHPWFFGNLYAFGTLLGGLALFLGALTRPAGFAAAVLFVCAYFMGPASEETLSLVLATACIACASSRAGRKAGADVFLDEKLPAPLTWSRA